jgi:hypothetical protein
MQVCHELLFSSVHVAALLLLLQLVVEVTKLEGSLLMWLPNHPLCHVCSCATIATETMLLLLLLLQLVVEVTKLEDGLLMWLPNHPLCHACSCATILTETMLLLLLQLLVEVTKLEGSLLMWLPPPPSDRLWVSFQVPPKVRRQRATLCALSVVET